MEFIISATPPTYLNSINFVRGNFDVACSWRWGSTVWVKKIPPWWLVAIFPKWLGIFQPNFTCLLCVSIFARLRIFIQLPTTLTKLWHIKRDHPVHIMCAKCPPSAETHFLTFFPNS